MFSRQRSAVSVVLFLCRARLVLGLLGLAAGLGLAACAGSSSPPVYVQPQPVSTRLSTGTVSAPVLPATWTPVFTPTPRPPTSTPTLTPIPTGTPTLDPAQLCQRFNLFAAPADGALVAYGGRIAYGWQGAPGTVVIYLTLLHRETGEGILVQWPPGQAFNMTVGMGELPYAGVYDWKLALHDEEQGDLCPVEGWFERLPEYPTITPTEHWVFPPTNTR